MVTTSQEIDTKSVQGRRQLHFNSIEEVLAAAEQLAQGQPQHLGNWSPGQIFAHLAKSMHVAIDGTDMKVPWVLRLLAPLMKKSMLGKTMRAGFKMPEGMKRDFAPPADISTEEGLQSLREAVHRWNEEPKRSANVIFGELTAEEHTALQLRHAEMHLSFLVPQ